MILAAQNVFSFISAGIFHQTFTSLQHITPEVLYPIPDFTAFQKPIEPISDDMVPSGEKLVFLSINRYERKKNLALAIKAFGKIADCMLYFVNGTVVSCFCFVFVFGTENMVHW